MVLTERKEEEVGAAAAVREAARQSSGKPQVTLRAGYTVFGIFANFYPYKRYESLANPYTVPVVSFSHVHATKSHFHRNMITNSIQTMMRPNE